MTGGIRVMQRNRPRGQAVWLRWAGKESSERKRLTRVWDEREEECCTGCVGDGREVSVVVAE